MDLSKRPKLMDLSKKKETFHRLEAQNMQRILELSEDEGPDRLDRSGNRASDRVQYAGNEGCIQFCVQDMEVALGCGTGGSSRLTSQEIRTSHRFDMDS